MAKKRRIRWLVTILALVAGLAAGYLLGRYQHRPCINFLVAESPDTST